MRRARRPGRRIPFTLCRSDNPTQCSPTVGIRPVGRSGPRLLAKRPSIRSKVEQRAKKRACVPLDHAHGQIDTPLARCSAQRLCCGAGHIHGVLPVPLPGGPPDLAPIVVPNVSPRGYAGINASGNRTSRAPPEAASAVRRHAFSTVASRFITTGAACTTAARKWVWASLIVVLSSTEGRRRGGVRPVRRYNGLEERSVAL